MNDLSNNEIRVTKTGDFQGLSGPLAGRVMHVTMILGSLDRKYAHPHAELRDLQMATRYTGVTYERGDAAKASADLREWLVQNKAQDIPTREVEIKTIPLTERE